MADPRFASCAQCSRSNRRAADRRADGEQGVGLHDATEVDVPSLVDMTRSSSVGLAYGGHVGFMFGPFRLGALFQQTRFLQSDDLNFNKLYLEAGLGGRRGIVGLNLSLAGG